MANPLIQTPSDLKGEFSIGRIVDLKRADWLNVMQGSSLANYVTSVESDTLRFKQEDERARVQMAEISEANEAVVDDVDLGQLGLDGEMGGGDLSEEEIERIQSKNNKLFSDENGDPYRE